MKTKKIQLDEKTIEVRKIPIGEYSNLLKAIERLPKHLQSVENLDSAKVIEILPSLMGEGLPDLLSIIALAVKLPYDEIAELGLKEVTLLIQAIFEVNDFMEVYKIIKKTLAHPALKKKKGVKPITAKTS